MQDAADNQPSGDIPSAISRTLSPQVLAAHDEQSPPTDFQLQGVVLGEVTEDLGVDAYGTLTVTGHPSSDLQWYVASRQGVFGTLDIDQQGQWHYQLENSISKVQALVAGQSMAESFVVLVADHSGVTHMTRLQIRVNGSNDLPVMAVVTPLDTREGGLAVHGQLIATDLDAGDQLIFSAAHPVTGFVLHDDGQYVFDPSSPVYDHLKSGEQQILDIPVAVTDRLGAQDIRILRIILTGSNDVPALQAEVRSAQENMPPLHGQLIGTDPDRGDTLVYSTTLLVPGFSLHTDGSYGFDPGQASYQHLAAGQTWDVVIPITVTDSVGASSTQNLTIKLTGSNDGAIIGGVSAGTASEDSAQLTTGQLSVADVDDGEALFVAQSGTAGTYGHFRLDENGQWSYQLDNSKPEVQALKTGDSVTDRFTVTSADGTTQLVTVTVTGKNDGAVIAGTDTGSVTEDQTATLNTSGQLTITDSDAGQDHFIAQASAAGNYGHFSLSEDGQWSYSADSSQAAIQQLKAGATLSDSFTSTSADGSTHTVTVTLTGTNDAPVLQAQSQSVTEDGMALHGHMVATDVDLGDIQTFSLTHAVDGFTLNADGSYRFDPSVAAYQHLAAGQTQTLAIPVTVTDSAGASSTQSLTITLTGTNDGATIGCADTGSTSEDSTQATTGQLTVTDTDDGEAHFVAQTGTAGSYGSFSLDERGQWHYTLANNKPKVQALKSGETVTDSFTVTSADGTTQQVTVSISGQDDGAVITGTDSGTVSEDQAATLHVSGGLSVSDPDVGQAHFSPLANLAGTYGSFSIDASGHWSYSADNSQTAIQQLKAGASLLEHFSVTSADGTTHTVTVTLTGTNDAPVLQAQHQSVTEGGSALHGQMVTTDIDQGDSQTFNLVQAVDGFTLNADGSYSFDPANPAYLHLAQGQSQTLTIPITVTDSAGASSTASLTITLSGSNDGAVIGGDSQGATTEDSGQLSTGQLTVADADDGEARFIAQTGTAGTYGSFSLDENGQWSYQLDNSKPEVQALKGGERVTDSFTVTSADGTTQQVTVTVTGKDDGAVIAGTDTGTVTEDQSATLQTRGQLTITDPDAGQVHFTAQSGVSGSYGQFSIDEAGHWTYSADGGQSAIQQLKASASLTDHLTVSSADGTTHIVTVTLQGTNDGATIGGASIGSTLEDKPETVTGQLTVADVDDGQAHFVAQTGSAGSYGQFALDENGHWSYQLDNSKPEVQALKSGDSVTDSFNVTSADGTAHQVTVSIAGRDDGAVIAGTDTGTVTEDQAATLQTGGRLSITDPDAGQAHFTAQAHVAGSYGQFRFGEDGQWSYSADSSQAAIQQLKAGATLTDHFTVHGADGTAHTVTVTLQGTNDAPVLAAQNQAVSEDGTQLTGQMVATDADAGDTKTFSSAQSVDGFTLNADGSYSFDPNHASYQHLAAGQTQDVVIAITVTDSAGATNTQSLTITVTGSNDAPSVIGVDTGRVVEDQTLSVSGKLAISDADDGQAHFIAQTATTGSYGSLTIGEDGLWQYQLDNTKPEVQALKSTETATDTFTVHSADGSSHNITVTIQGQRDNVVIGGVDVGVVKEDVSAVTGGHLVASGESAEFVPLQQHTTLGNFAMDASGAWTYTLDNSHASTQALKAGETATDTVSITHTDGTTHTVTITVMGTNDAPVLTAQSQAVTEDSTLLTGQITATDVDRGDTQIFSIAHAVDGFTLNTDGSYSFDPAHVSYQHMAAGQTQTLTIPIIVTDSVGASSTANLTITVAGTNDAPDIRSTRASARMVYVDAPSTSITGQLHVRDTDDGDTQTWSVSGGGQGHFGHLDFDAQTGRWTYQLDKSDADTQALKAGEQGQEAFQITVTDGSGASSNTVVRVMVVGTNDAPILTAQSQTVTEDGVQLSGHMVATDVDAGDTQSFSIATAVDGFTLNADGSYSFDPSSAAYQHLAAGQTQDLVIPVTVTDGAGARHTQNLTFTITGTNDGAVIGGAFTGAVTEDQAVKSGQLQASGQLTITDADSGEGHFISQTDVLGSGGLGRFSLDAQGHWTYNADNSQKAIQQLGAGATLNDSFTVQGADGAQHTVTVTLAGTNDAPQFHLQVAPDYHPEVESGDVLPLVINSIGSSRIAQYLDIQQILQGQVPIGAYANTCVTVSLGGLALIGPDGQAAQVFAAGQEFKLQTLVDWQQQGPGHEFRVFGPKGTTELDLSFHDAGDPNHITGPQGQASLYVNQVMIWPPFHAWQASASTSTATNSGLLTATEGGAPLSGQFHASDIDVGDTLSYSLGQPVDGFTLNADGSYNFDPAHPSYQHLAAGQSETLSIPITVTDSAGASSTQTLTILLRGANDAATFGGVETGATQEDRPDALSGQLTVADADDGEAHFIAQSGTAGSYGQFSLDENGQWHYQIDNSKPEVQALRDGQNVIDSFTVRSADGTAHTVNISIAGKNDAALITGEDHQTLTEDQNVSGGQLIAHGQLHASTPDAGGDQFTPLADLAGKFGHLSLSADGSWVYKADNSSPAVQSLSAGQSATESFTVHSVDGTAHTLSLSIQGADEPRHDIWSSIVSTIKSNWAPYNLIGHAIDAGDVGALGSMRLAFNSGNPSVVDANGHVLASGSSLGAFGHDISIGQVVDLLKSHPGARLVLDGNVGGSSGFYLHDSGDVMELHFRGLSHYNQANSPMGQVPIDGLPTPLSAAATVPDVSDSLTISVTDISVDHAGQLQTSGQLSISDADAGENHFHAQKDVAGTYGSFSIDASGHWVYSVDNGQAVVQNLQAGAQLTDSFMVTSADGTSHVVSVAVYGKNDAPVLFAQSQSVSEDGAQLSGQMHASDVDAGDTLSFRIDQPVAGFTLNADGSYSFDPSNAAYQHLADGQTETLVIPVFVTDHMGANSVQDLTITVTGASDGAVISGVATGTVTEDLTLSASGQLAITDADDGQAHFVAQTATAGRYGSLTIGEDGQWQYQLDNSKPEVQALQSTDTATDTFTVHSADGSSHSITVTIQGQRDSVVIRGVDVGVVKEDASSVTGGHLVATGESAEFVPVSSLRTTLGQFSMNADGAWTYALDNSATTAQALKTGETTTDTVSITHTDGTTHTITITVMGTNDAPVLAAQTQAVTEDGSQLSGRMVATDADAGETKAFSMANAVDGFTLNADGSYSFDPAHASYQHLAAGQTQDVVIPITVTDSAGETSTQNLTITVTGANDGAVIGGVDVATVTEDTAVTTGHLQASGQLSIKDLDTGEAHFTVQTDAVASHGHFSLDATGAWTYTADNTQMAVQQLKTGESLTDTLTVASADGATHTLTVTIQGTNDAPVLTVQAQFVTEDCTQLSGHLVATDADHGDTLTFSIANAVDGFTFNADGSYSFDPTHASYQHLAAGQTQDLVIPITVTDSTGLASTQNLTITVTGANDGPQVVHATAATAADLGAVNEDTPRVFTEAELLLAVGASDVDSTDSLHIVAGSLTSAHGTFTGDAAHGFTFTPAANFSGQGVDLQFSVTDGSATREAHVQLDITPVADAPLRVTAPTITTDFASISLPGVGWTQTDPSPTGWHTDESSGVEIGQERLYGGSGNNQILSLTASWGSNIYRELPTQAGEAVHLGFDLSARPGFAVTPLEVLWEGKVIDTITPVAGSYSMLHHDYDLLANGSNSRLELRASGQGEARVLIDNIQIGPPEHVVLGDHDTLLKPYLGFQLADTDGSETLSYGIHGLPVGFTLTDGTHSAIVSSAGQVIETAGWNQDTLAVRAPQGFQGTVSIQVTAHAEEGSNHQTANAADLTLELRLVPVSHAAVISGENAITLTEDQHVDAQGFLEHFGQLNVSDPDAGEAKFVAQNAMNTQYGRYTIGGDGYWLYETDNKLPAIQQLKTGESLTDSFTVHSIDGTPQTITVTILGQDDAPTFVPQTQAARVDSPDVYMQIGVQLLSSEHREFQFMGEVLLANTDPRNYIDAEMSFTNTGVALRAPDGSLSRVYHAEGGMTTVPVMDLRGWHNKGQGYDVVLVDATGMPINVFPHDAGDPDKMSGFNQYVTGFSGPFNAAVVLYPDMQAASSGGAVQSSAFVPAIAPVLYDAAHVLEDNGQQISGFIEVQDADKGQSSMQAMTDHHAAHGIFSIDVNGDWVYKLDTSRPDVQALKDGETLLETITVHSADGTPHEVNITIHGQNDGAVITGVDTGQLVEDQSVSAAGTLEAYGQLTVSDVDAGEAVFVAQNAVATKFGHFSIDASGAWRYEVDNNKAEVQALKPGGTPGETGNVAQTLAQVLSQSSEAGFHAVGEALAHGQMGAVAGVLDLSIQGAAIVLTGPAGSTPVVYAMDAQGRSTVGVDELLSWMHQGSGYEVHLQGVQTDVQAFVHDRGDAASLHGLPLSGVAELNDPAGAAQHLALQWHTAPVPGELSEVVTVASADGTTHQITLNIQGTAENAVISGVDSGSVSEDAQVSSAGLIEAHGQLAIQDPDSGQAAFTALHDVAGKFGHLTLEASGHWSYTADNNSAALNALNKGQSAIETFVVKSVDGTAHTINVTVNGADEKPDLWPEIARNL
ncbi:TPA: VCBS domain-containing protein, partial [Aeromonas sobria]|nr:VCBS domain-containing protein [Aeromonas sobria]